MSLRQLFQGSRDTETTSTIAPLTDPPVLPVGSHDTSGSEEKSTYAVIPYKIKKFFGRPAEDLFIELDEPHKVYGPADIVRGQVVLTLHKPTKTLYTVLTFRGQVSVGLGKQVVKSVLFQKEIILWGQKIRAETQLTTKIEATSVDAETPDIVPEQKPTKSEKEDTAKNVGWEVGTMEPGRHVFGFEFQFPGDHLPSSVDFGRGSINYSLRCDHQKPGSIRSRGRSSSRKDLAVLDAIEVGNLPIPKLRLIDPDIKHKRKEGTGKVQASVELTKAGYLKGDTIALNIQVSHVKPIKNMKGTIATLYRLSRFNSEEVAPQSFRKDLCQTISPLLVDPRSLSYKISTRLRIPADTFPTIKSAGPVSFRYFVEVVLDLNGRTTVWQGGTAASDIEAANYFSIESGGEAMETEALKREKGAHCVVFEVIIGTKDTILIRNGHPSNSSRRGQSRSLVSRTDFTISELSQHEMDRQSLLIRGDSSDRLSTTTQRSGPRSHNNIQVAQTKADLQRLENALVPSVPPDVTDDNCSHLSPSAPPESLVANMSLEESSSASVPVGRKEEEVLRERASAPGHHDEIISGTAPLLEHLDEDAFPGSHCIDLPLYQRRGETGPS